jgi:hypothetical protein
MNVESNGRVARKLDRARQAPVRAVAVVIEQAIQAERIGRARGGARAGG